MAAEGKCLKTHDRHRYGKMAGGKESHHSRKTTATASKRKLKHDCHCSIKDGEGAKPSLNMVLHFVLDGFPRFDHAVNKSFEEIRVVSCRFVDADNVLEKVLGVDFLLGEYVLANRLTWRKVP